MSYRNTMHTRITYSVDLLDVAARRGFKNDGNLCKFLDKFVLILQISRYR